MKKYLFIILAVVIIGAGFVIRWNLSNINFNELIDHALHEKMDGDLEKAKDAINEALELRPDSAEAHYFLGTFYLDEKNGEKALKKLDRAIDLDSTQAKYYVSRSFVYFNIFGDQERAVKEMEEALKIEPDNYQYQVTQGVYYEKLDQKEDAIKHYEAAIELESSLSGIKDKLIVLYEAVGDTKKAEELRKSMEKEATETVGSEIEAGENAY